MKVPLVIERRHYWRNADLFLPDIPIVKCLPFFVSRTATRVHRVRSGCIYGRVDGGRSHAGFTLWCGQHGLLSEDRPGNHVTASPPHWMPFCATCEGRAVGAGQLGSRELAGRIVVFSPRNPVHQEVA